jgi:organic hydroperoxide reductase OsmC/OhrA
MKRIISGLLRWKWLDLGAGLAAWNRCDSVSSARHSPTPELELEGSVSIHRAAVAWEWDGADFPARRYSRVHTLAFEGGLTVPGSPSPQVVPPPFSRSDALDPEAAFTASLSACHMLWFLDLAAGRGFTVVSYRDEAEGVLARIGPGRMAMTRVTLRPTIIFAAPEPDAEAIAALHAASHERCFIANSVKTEVVVESPGPAVAV